MQKRFVSLLVVLAITLQYEAKIFTRCGLVTELRKQGFPEDKLSTWVCIVENESARDTEAININTNDYGLFQINGLYWCTSSGPAGNGCNVTCADLITEDITKAAECALKVYDDKGFQAWTTWSFCNNEESLPDLSEC